MKSPHLHLNLLREDEKFSSSPVRLRVMLPILGLLLCVFMGVWWSLVFTRLEFVRGQIRTLNANLAGTKTAHSGAVDDLTRVRELQAELDQLKFYENGRRTYGGFLARLAETVPEHVQLTTLTIPEATPQQLKNPLNPKLPALLGPTNETERVVLRLTGRTPKAAPVTAFMETLAQKPFADWLVVGGTGAESSPHIRSFTQETAGGESSGHLLTFDVEYRMQERRFAK